jgi:hypothetical protein
MIIPSIAILLTSGAGKVPAVFAHTPDAKAASREHFNKGVAAFDAKRFGEAAEEFNAAYQEHRGNRRRRPSRGNPSGRNGAGRTNKRRFGTVVDG